jgi:hypothetical protein
MHHSGILVLNYSLFLFLSLSTTPQLTLAFSQLGLLTEFNFVVPEALKNGQGCEGRACQENQETT